MLYADSGGSSYGRTGRQLPSPRIITIGVRVGHGCAKQSASDPGGSLPFSLKSLTFGHFLYENGPKAFSFRGASSPGTPPGTLPLDPAGSSAPDTLRLSRSARSPYAPMAANPGSATVRRARYCHGKSSVRTSITLTHRGHIGNSL